MAVDRARLPVIGITMGDPAGIGPEIIVKALSDPAVWNCCVPLVIGDKSILEREIRSLTSPLVVQPVSSPVNLVSQENRILLLEASQLDGSNVPYGKPGAETGRALARYIETAVELALKGTIEAVVTAPISKQSLRLAGYGFPGHTEMLAHLTGTRDVVMMLAGSRLRVVLVTIHCPLANVPRLISRESILTTLRITQRGLREMFGIEEPRIAVAGLNPHAGEAGMFGREEQTVITPALEAARGEGIDARGPYPPDTLFYRAVSGEFDVVVCMYHDQGLIPLKLLHFDDGVNITLGLPIIRTSVDHGTAYDIAGKGIARPSSMLQAIGIAAQMALARRRIISP